MGSAVLSRWLRGRWVLWEGRRTRSEKNAEIEDKSDERDESNEKNDKNGKRGLRSWRWWSRKGGLVQVFTSLFHGDEKGLIAAEMNVSIVTVDKYLGAVETPGTKVSVEQLRPWSASTASSGGRHFVYLSEVRRQWEILSVVSWYTADCGSANKVSDFEDQLREPAQILIFINWYVVNPAPVDMFYLRVHAQVVLRWEGG